VGWICVLAGPASFIFQPVLSESFRRTVTTKRILARHRETVEHPFGIIKQWMNQSGAVGYILPSPVSAQHGGGHATLIPAPSEMHAEIPVFEPQPKALAGLSRRLKAAFDPYAILEPRRMWVEF
jgi:hypothetical protein